MDVAGQLVNAGAAVMVAIISGVFVLMGARHHREGAGDYLALVERLIDCERHLGGGDSGPPSTPAG